MEGLAGSSRDGTTAGEELLRVLLLDVHLLSGVKVGGEGAGKSTSISSTSAPVLRQLMLVESSRNHPDDRCASESVESWISCGGSSLGTAEALAWCWCRKGR